MSQVEVYVKWLQTADQLLFKKIGGRGRVQMKPDVI